MKAHRSEGDARLQALLEAIVDGIISIDERGIIQTINPAAERLFGYAATEVIGRNVKILMPSPYQEEHDDYIAHYLSTGEKKIIGIGREVVGLRKDGSTFPMELSVAEAPLGNERIFVGIVRDITERKRNEAKFRLVVESAPTAIVMVNARGNIVLVNAQAEKSFGYATEELFGKPVEILVPERFHADHPGYRARFFAAPDARPMGAGRELFGRRKDGNEFPVEIGLSPIASGEGLLVLAFIVDISARKRADEARASLAAIVESSSEAIIGQSLDGLITTWNGAATALYGYTNDEVCGHPITILMPPERYDEQASISATVRQGQGLGHFETVRLRKDGTRFDVSLTVSPIIGPMGKVIGASAIARDITEQKRAAAALQESKAHLEKALTELQARGDEVKLMTQQLWQAAKLASVGELAAGIAHELNNPLATVCLRVESVLARTPPDDPRRRALEIVEQEAKRMGDLVANLLQFSRRGGDEASTVDLRQELTKSVELINHLLRKRLITVVQALAHDTPIIYADRQKLRQVFLNLLTNAADAMPQGGTLTLRTNAATLENGKPGVRIEFSDTGVGIATEHLDKVMDPFFTTKEEGHGTGLGLAICRRVVQEHHGALEIRSTIGKGTTVVVALPIKNGANTASLRSSVSS